MPISLTAAGVTKTHNGYFVVHFSFTPTGGSASNYVVAIRKASEFYLEAIRAISGVGSGSTNDTEILNFTNGSITTTLNGAVNFDTTT
jgi:hypothetical protein